jgi:hypothetical protein
MATTIPSEVMERFVSTVAELANNILRRGEPIGYEALLLVAIK